MRQSLAILAILLILSAASAITTVTQVSPAGAASLNLTPTTFTYIVTYAGLGNTNCNISIDNVVKSQSSAIPIGVNVPTIIDLGNSTNGTHYWNVSCSNADGITNSATSNFTTIFNNETSCLDMTIANKEYQLTQNLTCNLNITADNITFSGAGNTLFGTLTIRSQNVRVNDFKSDPTIGILLNNSSNGIYTNLNIINATQFGILIANGSNNNRFSNLSINMSASGNATKIDLSNNNFFDCMGGIIIGPTTGNTYAFDSRTANSTNIQNCRITNFSLGAAFGTLFSGGNTKNETVNNCSIDASGGGNGAGIVVPGLNNTITNDNFTSGTFGALPIDNENSGFSLFENLTMTHTGSNDFSSGGSRNNRYNQINAYSNCFSNCEGIIFNDVNNTVANSTFSVSGDTAIWLQSGGDYNNFTNVTAYSNGTVGDPPGGFALRLNTNHNRFINSTFIDKNDYAISTTAKTFSSTITTTDNIFQNVYAEGDHTLSIYLYRANNYKLDNITIVGATYSLFAESSPFNNYSNLNITSGQTDIYLFNSTNSNIINVSAVGTSMGDGILLGFDTDFSLINNVNLTGASVGLYIDQTARNVIDTANIYGINTAIEVTSTSSANQFTNISNVYATSDNSNVVEIESDYDSLNNITAISNTGGSEAIHIPGSFATLSNLSGSSTNSYGIEITGSGDTLNTANAYSSSSWALKASGGYDTYNDFVATTDTGVAVYSNAGISNLTNFTAVSTSTGEPMLFQSAVGNLVVNGTFIQDTATGNLVDIESGSGQNTFYWCDFTDTTGMYVNDTSGTGIYFSNGALSPDEGNMWANVLNGSVIEFGTTPSVGFPFLTIGAPNYTDARSQGKTKGVSDQAPLTSQIGTCVTTCGTFLSGYQTYYLCNDVSAAGSDCFDFAAPNITLDCLQQNIFGDNITNTAFGIYSNQENSTIQNCNLYDWGLSGIAILNTDNALINNTNITALDPSPVAAIAFANSTNDRIDYLYTLMSGIANVYFINTSDTLMTNSQVNSFAGNGGISLQPNNTNITFDNVSVENDGGASIRTLLSSDINFQNGFYYSPNSYTAIMILTNNGINFINNTLQSDTSTPLAIASLNNSIFINNTLIDSDQLNPDAIIVSPFSSGNIFCWNNFSFTNAAYMNDSSGLNFYNSSLCNGEGNVWGNVMNGSVQILGTTNSTGYPILFVGIGGSGYPYGDNTSQGQTTGVIDYAPLTFQFSMGCTVANISYNSVMPQSGGTLIVSTDPFNLTQLFNGYTDGPGYFQNYECDVYLPDMTPVDMEESFLYSATSIINPNIGASASYIIQCHINVQGCPSGNTDARLVTFSLAPQDWTGLILILAGVALMALTFNHKSNGGQA